ncbi:MAG: ABC transporter C-terminal domain-containing protein [Planctomycetota bacterium]|nr:ABC transporter C-terminal domain-containing protein [Planctomycetota bacterium]
MTTHWTWTPSVSLVTAVLLVVTVTGGCRKTLLQPSPSDLLRREIAENEEQIASLEAQIGELETKLAAAGRPALPDGAIPAISEIRIGRLSALDPDDSSVFRVWIDPVDGRERFIQMAGSIEITVTFEDGSSLSDSFTAEEVRESWRGGFTGASYAFSISTLRSDGSRATLSPRPSIDARFTDLASGRLIEAHRDGSGTEKER